MEIKYSDKLIIFDDDIVTLTSMGHIFEIQYMARKNTVATIQKLNKFEYVDLSTGEIKDFKNTENRSQLENSLKQTFKALRYLINNNFYGKKNELHVTLTYKENMTDNDRLYTDLNKFLKRLKYKFNSISSLDYINVVEPQERGAWHCHLLIRFNDVEEIFIKSNELEKIWGHGFIKIKSLKEVDNIGAYLSAYLSDVELPEDLALEAGGSIKEVQGKKYLKGGRLHMYPTGMKIYRTSRGIKPPSRKTMKYKEAKKIVGSGKPHYSKSIKIIDDDFENTISYLQYNLKRQERKE